MWNTAFPSASCISDSRDNPQCTSEQPVPLITVEVPGQPDERGQLLSAGDTEWQETLEPMVLYVNTTGAEGSASSEQRGACFVNLDDIAMDTSATTDESVQSRASMLSDNLDESLEITQTLNKEVLCNEHQCPHQATVAELKRKLDLQQKKIRKLEQQLESVLGDSMDGGFLKDLIFSVIEKCEAAGCLVDAVISDMGPSNKALWKRCGISAKRSGEPVVSCRHPCAADTDRELFFLADAPHVLKNIRGHLVRQQSIFLPDDVVSKYSLPTNEVSVEHIKELARKDSEHDLKLAPHLKPSHLELNHYDKMDVSSAVAVLNHSVGAAIRVLVSLGQLEDKAITTAWFVEQVFKWFSLLTSRYIGTAMSHFKPQAHQEAVTFLKEFASMLARVTIRKGSERDQFKPVQTGVLITTTSALKIQYQLLNVYRFRFVLLCRRTQDALENLFSCVRSRNPVPRALEFKLTLRLIMLCQFFRPSRKGNYAIDDSIDLLEFVEVKKAAAEKNLDHSGTDEPSEEDLIFEDEAPLPLDDVEMESLVYVSGYIARSVSRRRKLCTTCKEYLEADPVEDSDRLLTLKSYRAEGEPNPLVRPSRHVVALLEHADNTFCSYENQVLKASLPLITKVALDSHQLPSDFPRCHDLAKHLTAAFLMLRMRITLRKLSSKAKVAKPKCGSKNLGMRAAAAQIR
ncbi:hypothetical protein HPB48_026732 [Haemaphysalis longicornis]|uniref:Transposable element P transposase-like GTP-binding insertion domain-containing protein n=1 Tax=Haemaphysalis longicornis TaxID=44386 RepID=A0A9J6HAI1_HAELO|nr:hypothetical protein HPB48_026732 [Haemaphysalis longicornis]